MTHNYNSQTQWNGVTVMNTVNGNIREVFVIPENMTLSQCIKANMYIIGKHIDIGTVILNKERFYIISPTEVIPNSGKVYVPEKYIEAIGKRVTKTGKKPVDDNTQPKPFKSTFLVNTVKGIIPHPQLPGEWAYTFFEDSSYVSCKTCKVVENE